MTATTAYCHRDQLYTWAVAQEPTAPPISEKELLHRISKARVRLVARVPFFGYLAIIFSFFSLLTLLRTSLCSSKPSARSPPSPRKPFSSAEKS